MHKLRKRQVINSRKGEVIQLAKFFDTYKVFDTFNMITTPEIIIDVFSFLDKDQIERFQLVSQFWNNVIIRHKNILPLRQFSTLHFNYERIIRYTTKENNNKRCASYIIKFDGTNLSKGTDKKKKYVSSRYSQMTVDEVLKNLNDVVFVTIHCNSWDLDNLFNMMKLITTKTGGRFRGQLGTYYGTIFASKLYEVFDNYIRVDELALHDSPDRGDSYIREVCVNPEIVQLPSVPKEIRLVRLEFKENDEVLHFTCDGKLNGANRLTIDFETLYTNFENFIRQWFELYRTHENPISLVGKFELRTYKDFDSVLDAVKTFLNNNQLQLRVKYSLETKEFHSSFYGCINYQYLKRSCVLHETDSYALVIEMAYRGITDMSSINASDLDQPPCDQMETISFCVKSL